MLCSSKGRNTEVWFAVLMDLITTHRKQKEQKSAVNEERFKGTYWRKRALLFDSDQCWKHFCHEISCAGYQPKLITELEWMRVAEEPLDWRKLTDKGRPSASWTGLINSLSLPISRWLKVSHLELGSYNDESTTLCCISPLPWCYQLITQTVNQWNFSPHPASPAS